MVEILVCRRCGARYDPGQTRCARCGHRVADVEIAPGADRPRLRRRIQVGRPSAATRLGVLAVPGGIAVALSGVFAWLDPPSRILRSQSAWEIPVDFLVDPHYVDHSGLRIGAVLVGLGVVGAFLGFFPAGNGIRRLFGLAAVAVAVVFAAQLLRLTLRDDSVAELFGSLGAGVYVAFFGGLFVAR